MLRIASPLPAGLRLICCAVVMALAGSAAPPSTVALTSSANPSALSQAPTLTATVAAGATGTVTFYDSAVILGFATLSQGQAILKTSLLPSGLHTLRAYYTGDAVYSPAESAPFLQTVIALPANGYQQGVASGIAGFNPINSPVLADFNGDGKLDLAIPGSPFTSSSVFSIYLIRGDGSFQLASSYAGALMATGDFNGDGIVDLIVYVATNGAPNVTVFLGNGDGTFRQAGSFPAGVSNLDAVAVADFNDDGKADLVTAYNNGGQSFLLYGNGDGTFQAAVTGATETAGPPSTMVTADFNLDGKADLYGVTVHLGNGNGTFQPPITTLAGGSIGDFNGDGIPDFIAAGASLLDVRLGNGDGTFQAALFSPAPTGQLAIGDFNGDGKLDALNLTSTGAWLSLGNGAGTFQPAVNLTTVPASGGIAGDFNGDGRTDFILFGANGASTTFLAVALPVLSIAEVRSGSFSPGTVSGYSITAGNVGYAPTQGVVTVSDSLPPGLAAFTMGGAGWSCVLTTVTCTRSDSLAPSASYPPIALAVAVGSNVGDVIVNMVTVSGGGAASNSATDTFTARNAIVTLSSSANPAILGQPVTLNATLIPGGTGRVAFYDSAASLGASTVVNGQASLTTRLLAGGNHSLQARFDPNLTSLYTAGASATLMQTVNELPANGLNPVVSYSTPDFALYIVEGDFNGDGIADLAYAGDRSLGVLLGRGDGTFGAPIVTPFPGFIGLDGLLVAADFNGDGKSDLLMALNSSTGASTLIALGNGDGTFKPATLIGNGLGDPVVGDFNRDGNLDVASIGGASARTLTVLLGNGDGTFAAPLISTLTESAGYPGGNFGNAYILSTVAADFNGDGKVDLAFPTNSALSASTTHVMVLLGNGDGTFQAPLISIPGIYPYLIDNLFMADFNLDGKPDLAINYFGFSEATVLLGNGDGTFQPSIISYPGTIAAVGDVNGDGKPDLITHIGANNIEVRLGKGDGTFQAPVGMATGGSPGPVVVGDFNGDGKADLAVANGQSDSVGILLGSSSARINLTVWRPSTGVWYVDPVSGSAITQSWGLFGDTPIMADFDGDGALDYAVWRPSNGTWYVIPSSSPAAPLTTPWGLQGDVPVAGNFNGAGKAEYAVWRPSNGTWYTLPSAGAASVVKQWGLTGDIPMVADFDGDGKADYAVWRPSNGTWYITLSSTGATIAQQWGLPGDVPVAADFDGDGKADFAVWRPSNGTWYIIPSSTGIPYVVQWGAAGDIPVPRDYDLDGKADIAVWRPSNATWYIVLSATPTAPLTIQWGLTNDVPLYKPAGN